MAKNITWPGAPKAIWEGIQSLKQNPTIVIIYLALGALTSLFYYLNDPYAIGFLQGPPPPAEPDFSLLNLFTGQTSNIQTTWLWAGVVTSVAHLLLTIAGLAKFELSLADSKKLSVQEWLEVAVKRLPIAFVVGLVAVIAVMAGFVALIIPGIILLAWLSLTYYLVVDETKLSFTEYFRRSIALAKGNVGKIWALIGTGLVIVIALGIVVGWVPVVMDIILGLVSLGVGVAFARLYRFAQVTTETAQ